MEQNEMNLVQKLAAIRSIADVAQKSKSGFNYKYADITEILAKVTTGMKKYGVSLIPGIVPGTSSVTQNVTTNVTFDKTGTEHKKITTEMLYAADMVYRWVNDENPDETIEVPWFATGSQSDPSQAMGSALTYTQRQFLLAYFQIAQEEGDVDAYRSKQKEAEQAEGKAVAEGIIEQFDGLLKTYLSDHPDKKASAKEFCQRYIKSGDYFRIADPALAAKMLNDFKHTYLQGE